MIVSPKITLFLVLICTSLSLAAGNDSGEYFISLDDLSPQAISRSLNQEVRGYRVGIALSGGGARGFAHIGVLRALDEAGIEIDVVAGTSMGGIIGGLYAAGMTPDEIQREAMKIEWTTFFSDKPRRTSVLFTRRAETEGALIVARFAGLNPQIPTALGRGQKLVNMLNDLSQTASYFSGGDFANLSRRLAIVSTDLISGQKVTFTSGSLVEALRATMGVPLAFTPLEKDGQLLMDGGLLEPVPTETARSLGADFVIAVDATTGLLSKDEINSPIDIANQTTTILSTKARVELLASADYVISPDLSGIKSLVFRSDTAAIDRGYESAKKAIPEIRRLLAQKFALEGERHVHTVVNAESGWQASDTVERLIGSIADSDLSNHQLRKQVNALYRTGYFSSVNYVLTPGDSGELQLNLEIFPKITSICFEGNRVYADSVLHRTANLQDRPVTDLRSLKSLYDSLISLYRLEGYDLAQIKGAWLDSSRTNLTIVIDEGQIIGISVEGAVKTRWWVVASYFNLQVGDFYNKIRASRGVQEIYSSGLYENVNLRLEERSGGVHITIMVKEIVFAFARLGARYHETFHPEAFLRMGYSNLFGTGHELSSYVKFSERRKLYLLQLRADRVFRTFVTYRVQSYYSNDKIGLFDDDVEIGARTVKRWGLKVGVGQQLFKLGLLEVLARYEQIRFTDPPNGPTSERRVASLVGSLRYDTKDRYTFPTRGQVVELMVEASSDILGADEVIRKFEGSIEGFQKLSRKLILHPKGAIGLSQSALPDYDKFYLGGSRTFYGYQTDQLAGDKYLSGSLELRLGPVYSFYLSGRYDVGDVFGTLEDVRFDNLRHGFGTTLSLDTFVGPLSFGYGRSERKYDNLYLNLGYDF